MSFGPNPWQQAHWDARAACNFACGGAGAGLVAFAAVGVAPRGALAAGAALVAIGLLAVWAEIGRPLRALNVFANPRTSWMSREAWVAPPLLVAAGLGALGVPGAAAAAALLALAFVGCQARILHAARGIPAWREGWTVPLVVATGLAGGCGLALAIGALAGDAPPRAASVAVAAALVARWGAWREWRARIRCVPRALAALDAGARGLHAPGWAALAVALAAAASPTLAAHPVGRALVALAGLGAAAGGAAFVFALVTRGAFNQGFALEHLPVRGARRGP
jgi:phenylacetyl-CoA:acceptor oxidoreductase subunit 2